MLTSRHASLQLILFLVTLLSTVVAGALQQGINPFETPGELWRGIPFSFTLLIILASHEFGHYFIALKRDVQVTLPYFIPAPSFIGTFGAFIRLRSPITDRNILLDIGAAGPISGLLVSIPVLLVGLMLSETHVSTGASGTGLGNSLLFSLLSWIVFGPLPDNIDVILHPIAFSGWIGLLITCFNLMPVGQLDGGHVAYAVFGYRQRALAWIMLAILFILGLTGWLGWLVWAFILLAMRIAHPPVVYDWIPLDGKRRAIGWITMGIFLLTFTPEPF